MFLPALHLMYILQKAPHSLIAIEEALSSVEVVFVVDVNDNYIIKNDAQTLACIAFKVVQFLMLALYKLISNVNPSFLEFKTRYCITPLFAVIFEDKFTFWWSNIIFPDVPSELF